MKIIITISSITAILLFSGCATTNRINVEPKTHMVNVSFVQDENSLLKEELSPFNKMIGDKVVEIKVNEINENKDSSKEFRNKTIDQMVKNSSRGLTVVNSPFIFDPNKITKKCEDNEFQKISFAMAEYNIEVVPYTIETIENEITGITETNLKLIEKKDGYENVVEVCKNKKGEIIGKSTTNIYLKNNVLKPVLKPQIDLNK